MALSSAYIVRVEKQPEGLFCDIMNGIRLWLDHRKIQPVSFKPVANVQNGVGFEIAFNSENEACLFERAFRPGPA